MNMLIPLGFACKRITRDWRYSGDGVASQLSRPETHSECLRSSWNSNRSLPASSQNTLKSKKCLGKGMVFIAPQQHKQPRKLHESCIVDRVHHASYQTVFNYHLAT
ncbi:hypothetical protein TNCV_4588391 [Trichonephila clavipes]|nr:hypothetical protein TNCV_4588391 [Trichonephila clavipes]